MVFFTGLQIPIIIGQQYYLIQLILELPIGPPLFKGHGYLVLSKLSSLTKREGNDEVTMDNETQFISLNFSTAHDNGLLIWTSQVRTKSRMKIKTILRLSIDKKLILNYKSY